MFTTTTKRAKTTRKVLSRAVHSKITKNGPLSMAVIDKGNKDVTISICNWKKEELTLDSVFFKVILDRRWLQRRVKMIMCADFKSLYLNMIALSKIGAI